MSGFFSKFNEDKRFLFVNKNNLSRKNRRRKKRAQLTVFGLVLAIIQLVVMVLFLLQIFKLDMLPIKYLIMLNIVLFLIFLYNLTSQFTNAHIFGKILSVLMSGIMIFGFLFSSKLNSTLEEITGTSKVVDTVDIVVLANDKANTIKDTVNYTYGYNSNVGESTITKAIADIDADYSAEISTKEYTAWTDILDALYDNKDIKVMILTDTMYISIAEQYEDFKEKTKIVGTVEITSEIKLSASEKKVNEEPFVVYLSGDDSTGTISTIGHSDVNILAICNPVTRQVLLVSTPRDSFVRMTDSSGRSGLDKLTHASNAGIEHSIEAIENIYGINIDYYARINFTGCIGIVDALGGITINSNVEFENGWEAWYNTYHYNLGPNQCDGEKTLAFVRERKAFLDGDFQRGKNQEAALAGIIDKVTSPAILTNYSGFLDSISDMLITNMPTTTISSLVKGQLSNNDSWNIQSYSAEGTTGERNGQLYDVMGMSIVILDNDSINLAIQLMSKITNGDIFDVDEYVEEYKNSQNSSSSTVY